MSPEMCRGRVSPIGGRKLDALDVTNLRTTVCELTADIRVCFKAISNYLKEVRKVKCVTNR